MLNQLRLENSQWECYVRTKQKTLAMAAHESQVFQYSISAGTMKVRSTPLLRSALKEELGKYEEVDCPLVLFTEKVFSYCKTGIKKTIYRNSKRKEF